jgi:hypothetical protein
MSWLFSQALVAEYLQGTCSAGELCAPSSGSPTPQAFLSPDRMTAFSRLSQFGMTCRPLTEDLGAGLLTWFREASRARTSAQPAEVLALTESAAACGATWRASLAKYDRALRMWRTAQCSLLGDLEEFSETWPTSGMTVDGQCWELVMSAPRTAANESGWWPTPQRSDYKGTSSGSKFDSRARQFRIWSKGQNVTGAIYPNPTAYEGLMGWPLGWTDLKPLAMGRFHSAPQRLGES